MALNDFHFVYFHSLKIQKRVVNALLIENVEDYNGELCTWFDKLEFSFFFLPYIEKLHHPACSTVLSSFFEMIPNLCVEREKERERKKERERCIDGCQGIGQLGGLVPV